MGHSVLELRQDERDAENRTYNCVEN
jgi:hypothetical protein